MQALLQDLRYGGRIIRKQPGYSLLIVLTLALAIGANTVIFSFANVLVLRPLPVKDQNTLGWIFMTDPQRGGTRGLVSIPDLLYRPGERFLHPIAHTAFRDADPGVVLQLRAWCDDGQPLPRWLHFDPRRRAFVGTGPATVEELRITVIASDVDGMEARSVFTVRRVTPG